MSSVLSSSLCIASPFSRGDTLIFSYLFDTLAIDEYVDIPSLLFLFISFVPSIYGYDLKGK